MKKILLAILLAGLLCTVVFAEEAITNLTGTWEGTSMQHKKEAGFKTGETVTTWVIKEQDGRMFYGEKVWVLDGKKHTESFSGIISLDNKHFYMADHINGYVTGDIVSEDKIAVYYIEEGKDAKAIFIELNKVK